MRTCIIAFLVCMGLSTPSLASDSESCRNVLKASQNMIEATKAQINELSRVQFQDAAIIMKPMDREAAYAMAQARNEMILALQKFLNNQINFLGALERCS